MVEEDELRLLYDASNSLKSNEYIIEFGTFLGSSTIALALGLRSNDSVDLRQESLKRLYSFDLFKCSTQTVYGMLVRQAAKYYKFDLDFEGVDVHYFDLVKHITTPFSSFISLHQGAIEGMNMPSMPEEMKLGILHLDAPKSWDLLKIIFEKTVNCLDQGSILIEQDMFFECSPEIVYVFWYLESHQVAHYYQSAASSAYYKWNGLSMKEKSKLIDSIDEHIYLCRTDIGYYKENTNSIISFFSKAGLTDIQSISLGTALINFAASLSFSEEKKIRICIEIMNYYGLNGKQEFFPKLYRVLNRSIAKFSP